MCLTLHYNVTISRELERRVLEQELRKNNSNQSEINKYQILCWTSCLSFSIRLLNPKLMK